MQPVDAALGLPASGGGAPPAGLAALLPMVYRLSKKQQMPQKQRLCTKMLSFRRDSSGDSSGTSGVSV